MFTGAHRFLPFARCILDPRMADARRLAALWTHDNHIRRVDASLFLDNPALRIFLRRLRRPFNKIDILDNHAARIGEHFEHFTLFRSKFSRNHERRVILVDVKILCHTF